MAAASSIYGLGIGSLTMGGCLREIPIYGTLQRCYSVKLLLTRVESVTAGVVERSIALAPHFLKERFARGASRQARFLMVFLINP